MMDKETRQIWERFDDNRDPETLWGPVFDRHQPLMLFGKSGSGKSRLALSLALAWVEGRDQHVYGVEFKGSQVPHNQRKALVYALDRPWQILESLRELTGGNPPKELIIRTALPDDRKITETAKGWETIPKAVEELGGVGLIVLDAIKDVIDDFMQPANIGPLTQTMTECYRRDLAVIQVTHSRKDGDLAGSPLLLAQAGGTVQMERPEGQRKTRFRFGKLATVGSPPEGIHEWQGVADAFSEDNTLDGHLDDLLRIQCAPGKYDPTAENITKLWGTFNIDTEVTPSEVQGMRRKLAKEVDRGLLKTKKVGKTTHFEVV